MNKHILFIVENNSAPNDRRVWSEACAVKDMGYEVSVVCPGNKKKYVSENINGIRVYYHPRPKDRHNKAGLLLEYANAIIWEMLLSLKIFISHPFHAIHAANPPDHLFLVALPFRLFGVKFLFDHHDISPENFMAKFGQKGFFYRILLLMERLTFRSAHVVISTNESYKKIAMDRGGKKASEIYVVRNGPDLTKTEKAVPDESLRKGFAYLVGYVGVIAQQEGIENLLRIASYLINEKKRLDIRFIIVGTGPYWQQMVELSEKMGLKDNVRFTGFLPDSELYKILATVDVCVNPEFRNEFTDRSTMIKIMEYMSFGKPIVQYHTTEGEVSAGDAAIYIRNNSESEFADALLQLLEDPDKRNRMGSLAHKRIQESLSWQRQQINLQNAYDTLFS